MSSDLDEPDDGRWKARLSKTIVSQVIPTLYQAHGEAVPGRTGSDLGNGMRRRAEAEHFLGLVLSDGHEAQWQHLLSLRATGMDLEAILTEIMAPAVRELGELWLDDRLSFVEVTTRSARLQQMIGALGRLEQEEAAFGPSLLLAAAPGEQHTFGLFVLAEMFLAAGWRVSIELRATTDELCSKVEMRTYDAIGLSVGSERFLPGVEKLVTTLRNASKSSDTRIFLGGWAFTVARQSLDDYGADLIATDGRSAVERAGLLLRP
ncbi:cobalamin B12-binding domain-containing protein [Jiella marina]|uniref:cobalamin B12-binding domain-containing protein n=1 Tax=Jiella sp. LLJ827 TaxID=2917712 RepID=UPI002100E9D9|nr:cobalamin B12-binding domain-containing protein [Jiella sp. LLJ827]MCQ0986370.1 cobalamin B12-binding domain-containing protein [Jiella sp. LLJ827]